MFERARTTRKATARLSVTTARSSLNAFDLGLRYHWKMLVASLVSLSTLTTPSVFTARSGISRHRTCWPVEPKRSTPSVIANLLKLATVVANSAKRHASKPQAIMGLPDRRIRLC